MEVKLEYGNEKVTTVTPINLFANNIHSMYIGIVSLNGKEYILYASKEGKLVVNKK